MIQLKVAQMTCNHCVSMVTKAIRQADPAATVQVDLAAQKVGIDSQLGASELIEALADAGYPATVATAG